MNWLDYAVIGVIVVSMVWSALRGVVREILSLGGWIIAFLAANLFADAVRDAFDPLGLANPGKMFPDGTAPALAQHGLHPLEKAGLISRE